MWYKSNSPTPYILDRKLSVDGVYFWFFLSCYLSVSIYNADFTYKQ